MKNGTKVTLIDERGRDLEGEFNSFEDADGNTRYELRNVTERRDPDLYPSAPVQTLEAVGISSSDVENCKRVN